MALKFRTRLSFVSSRSAPGEDRCVTRQLTGASRETVWLSVCEGGVGQETVLLSVCEGGVGELGKVDS